MSDDDARRIATKIILGMWGAWLLYWYVKAFNTKKSVYVQPRWQRLMYLVPGISIVLVYQIPLMRQRFWPFGTETALIGILVSAAGFAFCIWARVVLGRNWSGIVTVKEGHELVQSGPYRLVRHPIYTGLLLAAGGNECGALTPTPGGFFTVVMLTASFYFKLLQEEKVMTKEFPEAYPDV